MTLTVEVTDDLASLPAAAIDALRDDVNRYAVARAAQVVLSASVALAGETGDPVQVVSWQDLTGYTDEEEADFAARLGDHGPALAATLAPVGVAE